MMVSIDRAGRIVVPKAIREELDLTPEIELSVAIDGDSIRLTPVGKPTRRLAFTQDGRPYFPATDDTTMTDLDLQRLRDAQQR